MSRDRLLMLIAIVAVLSIGGVVYMSDWKRRAQLVVSADQYASLMSLLNVAEDQYGIPRDLLARQAWQESSFNPAATNPSGAQGLMQLMPQYYPGVDPFDPVAAVSAAAQTMAANFKTFGSWSLALAAYNAGAGNVRKYGGIPPFPETENYVAKIIGDVNAEGGAQVA
jgi:soluble lytic murein transglycosylase-like protein